MQRRERREGHRREENKHTRSENIISIIRSEEQIRAKKSRG